MRYPKELVNNFGAKAGILMYVADKLPNIPQAKMIFKNPSESIEDVLKRAEKSKILYPRILRSSAAAELEGYEGQFPTYSIEGPNAWFFEKYYPSMNLQERTKRIEIEEKSYIERIQKSPRELKENEPGKHDNLPDDISVIIAEQSPSSIVGTYIKHPNQDDFYVISISTVESLNSGDPVHSAFTFSSKRGINVFEGFSQERVEKNLIGSFYNKKSLHKELKIVATWHDQITNLPLMDSNWTCQIEFGLNPICLYQVRPFKKIEKSNFEIKPSEEYYNPLVFGITSEEGINVRAETNIWERYCNEEIINSENYPALFSETANKQKYVPNVKVNILERAFGILAHEDISAIRKADISGLFVTQPEVKIKQGKWYNVKSDGKNIQIKEK